MTIWGRQTKRQESLETLRQIQIAPAPSLPTFNGCPFECGLGYRTQINVAFKCFENHFCGFLPQPIIKVLLQVCLGTLHCQLMVYQQAITIVTLTMMFHKNPLSLLGMVVTQRAPRNPEMWTQVTPQARRPQPCWRAARYTETFNACFNATRPLP